MKNRINISSMLRQEKKKQETLMNTIFLTVSKNYLSSHCTKHPKWKICPHGVWKTSSDGTNNSLQITHIIFILSSLNNYNFFQIISSKYSYRIKPIKRE